MQSSDFRSYVVKALIFIWAILCILLFMILLGKVTYIQWANLAEWQLLTGNLGRLHPSRDLANLFRAFAGFGVFSVACTSLGIFVTKKTKIDNTSNSITAVTRIAFLATEF